MVPISPRLGFAACGLLVAVAAGATFVASRRHDEPAPVARPATQASMAPVAAPPAPSFPAPSFPAPSFPAPSFDVVRVAPGGNAVFAGRAEPSATVSIQSNGAEIGTAKADSRGEWVFLPSAPLPPGAQQLALVARGAAGGDLRSDGTVLLVVPDRAAPATTAPDPVLAVLSPPSGAPRVLQGPAPAPAGRLSLDVVDYDTGGQIRFTGAGPANAPVRVYVDNASVGDARTDGAGRWTLEPGATVKPGVHAVRVDQLGAKGQVLSRVEMPFQRADLPSLEPGRVVVQPGQNLWRLARQAYGAGVRYMVIYRANQDQIRDPARIYPGQAFTVPGGS